MDVFSCAYLPSIFIFGEMSAHLLCVFLNWVICLYFKFLRVLYVF